METTSGLSAAIFSCICIHADICVRIHTYSDSCMYGDCSWPLCRHRFLCDGGMWTHV